MGLVVGWPRRRMGQQMVGEVGARGLSLFGGQTLQLWRRSLDAWRVRLFYQKSRYLSMCSPPVLVGDNAAPRGFTKLPPKVAHYSPLVGWSVVFGRTQGRQRLVGRSG